MPDTKEFVQKYVNVQEVVPKMPIVKIEKFVTFFRKNKENHTPHTPTHTHTHNHT